MQLTHLQRYTRPAHFVDFADVDRTEYFVPYGQHRDSDVLTRSNFRCILRALGGESDTVLVLRSSHFAVGWIEGIYIHESDTARLETADRLLAKLEDYPIVSEEDYSALECDEAFAYWSGMSVRERVYWCQRYRVSIFAARRGDDIPDDPSGELLSALAE